MSSKSHQKARSSHPLYPDRFQVYDDLVLWSVEYPDYAPIPYTAETVFQNDLTQNLSGKWADPEDISKVDFGERYSYEGPICKNSEGRPINPIGRTGMIGRGLLGCWGPNHVADPILIKFQNGNWQVLVIKRKDTGEWALPGGMVDKEDRHISTLLKREFTEEAFNINDDTKLKARGLIKQLFSHGPHKIKVYSGYLDDPRNTDNAWMEIVAYAFICTPEIGGLPFRAGDDAVNLHWMIVDQNSDDFNKLYANHKELIQQAVQAVDAL